MHNLLFRPSKNGPICKHDDSQDIPFVYITADVGKREDTVLMTARIHASPEAVLELKRIIMDYIHGLHKRAVR